MAHRSPSPLASSSPPNSFMLISELEMTHLLAGNRVCRRNQIRPRFPRQPGADGARLGACVRAQWPVSVTSTSASAPTACHGFVPRGGVFRRAVLLSSGRTSSRSVQGWSLDKHALTHVAALPQGDRRGPESATGLSPSVVGIIGFETRHRNLPVNKRTWSVRTKAASSSCKMAM